MVWAKKWVPREQKRYPQLTRHPKGKEGGIPHGLDFERRYGTVHASSRQSNLGRLCLDYFLADFRGFLTEVREGLGRGVAQGVTR